MLVPYAGFEPVSTVAATREIDECLRGGLVDVPSTMLRYPPSISSSVGTRSFCECARIWQSEYDLVTRNQPLYTVAEPSSVISRAAYLLYSALTTTDRHAVLTQKSSRCPHARPHIASDGLRWSCGVPWLRPWSVRPSSRYFRNG